MKHPFRCLENGIKVIILDFALLYEHFGVLMNTFSKYLIKYRIAYESLYIYLSDWYIKWLPVMYCCFGHCRPGCVCVFLYLGGGMLMFTKCSKITTILAKHFSKYPPLSYWFRNLFKHIASHLFTQHKSTENFKCFKSEYWSDGYGFECRANGNVLSLFLTIYLTC